MSLQPFFRWMQALPLSEAIQQSAWIIAVGESLHLVALAVFAGAVLIVDLRLLGVGLMGQSRAQVARDARPWLVAGLLGLLATGVVQLVGTAAKQYGSPFFWIKVDFLIPALIFMFTVRRKVALADEGRVGPFWSRVVGTVSILLWLGVAIPARLIGLL